MIVIDDWKTESSEFRMSLMRQVGEGVEKLAEHKLFPVTASSVKPYSQWAQSLPKDHRDHLRLHVCWQGAADR